ncbi:hypothetical protein [Cohnella herbarum]|uniref:Uncharacterized protein n=1 Tax=Cohnella herbarum TaxID=2728023 RepID=A0A7Z2ZLX4_9BACL|nr:hypothetical protein [Cohnella herbarum]QJD84364.1 hypothetical protein HH215_15055 [Cohnella herbarum]
MLISWLILFSSITNGGAAPAAAAPVTAVYPQPASQQLILDGIELGAKGAEVKEAWGNPSKIVSDEWSSDCEIWSYKGGKNVGMCDDNVSYVQVMADAKKANLNGTDIAMVNKDLRQALGKPEFKAEDGWGIVRGSDAIKVFVDEKGKLVSVDLFPEPCPL